MLYKVFKRVTLSINYSMFCQMFSPKMSLFEVVVYILDTNDNKPTFSEDLFETEISETVQVGYKFSIPHATDDDIGL